MKFSEKLVPILVVGVLAVGGAALAMRFFSSGGEGYTVDVNVPPLSPLAIKGKAAFDANCAQCHGKNAAGTDKGPPFVHDIYNPGHHSDEAFFFAAQRGVQRHHWTYGNMPAQPQVSRQEVSAIVRYVRELQEANGIFTRPHNM